MFSHLAGQSRLSVPYENPATPPHLQNQITKLECFNEWACMELSILKCTLTDKQRLLALPTPSALKINNIATKTHLPPKRAYDAPVFG